MLSRPEVITRIVNKTCVLFNIRESRLEYMFHRKHISEAQYISGSRYRRLCEISQLGSGTSNMQPRIDGYYDAMLSRVGALSELVKISQEVGPEAIQLLSFIVGKIILLKNFLSYYILVRRNFHIEYKRVFPDLLFILVILKYVIL